MQSNLLGKYIFEKGLIAGGIVQLENLTLSGSFTGTTATLSGVLDGTTASFSGKVTVNAGQNDNSYISALGSPVGNGAADDSILGHFFASAGNVCGLLMRELRIQAGSDHQGTASRIQRRVDSTAMGFIDFRSDVDRQIVIGSGAANFTRWDNYGNIFTNASLALGGDVYFGSMTRQMVNLYSSAYGIGIQSYRQYFRTDGGFCWYKGGVHDDATDAPGSGGDTLAKLDENGDLYIKRDLYGRSLRAKGPVASLATDVRDNTGQAFHLYANGDSLYFWRSSVGDLARINDGGGFFANYVESANRIVARRNNPTAYDNGQLELYSASGDVLLGFHNGAANAGSVIFSRSAGRFEFRGNPISNWAEVHTGVLRTKARYYPDEYIEFPTIGVGLVSAHNGAYLDPNPGSYGSWRIAGQRNGWYGIEIDAGTHKASLMFDGGDTFGIHRHTGGAWRMYLTGGDFYVPGNITAYWSDRRLKENFRDLSNVEVFDTLGGMRAQRFNWNAKVTDLGLPIAAGKEEIGLIAQDVEAVLPDAVRVNRVLESPDEARPDFVGPKQDKSFKTIDWNKITPLLVEAVNRLHERVEQLEGGH